MRKDYSKFWPVLLIIIPYLLLCILFISLVTKYVHTCDAKAENRKSAYGHIPNFNFYDHINAPSCTPQLFLFFSDIPHYCFLLPLNHDLVLHWFCWSVSQKPNCLWSNNPQQHLKIKVQMGWILHKSFKMPLPPWSVSKFAHPQEGRVCYE